MQNYFTTISRWCQKIYNLYHGFEQLPKEKESTKLHHLNNNQEQEKEQNDENAIAESPICMKVPKKRNSPPNTVVNIEEFDVPSEVHEKQPLTSQNSENSLFRPIPTSFYKPPKYIIPFVKVTPTINEIVKKQLSLIDEIGIYLNLKAPFQRSLEEMLYQEVFIHNFHLVLRRYFFKILSSVQEISQTNDRVDPETYLSQEAYLLFTQIFSATQFQAEYPQLIIDDMPYEVKEQLQDKQFGHIMNFFAESNCNVDLNYFSIMGIMLGVKFKPYFFDFNTSSEYALECYGDLTSEIELPLKVTINHFSIGPFHCLTPADGHCMFHITTQYLIAILKYECYKLPSEDFFKELNQLNEPTIDDLDQIGKKHNRNIHIFYSDENQQANFNQTVGDQTSSLKVDIIHHNNSLIHLNNEGVWTDIPTKKEPGLTSLSA